MKRLIIFLLLFAAIKVAGQTTGYLRFDTVKIMKQNGTCELYLINKTKDSLGLLTNVGGGLTQFRKSRMLNDSTLVVGLDTLVIRGGTSAPGGIDQLTGDGAAGPGTGSQVLTISANAITNPKLAQMPALTVKVNPTNSTANAQDLAFSTDGNVLVRDGTTLITGPLDLSKSGARTGLLPEDNLAAFSPFPAERTLKTIYEKSLWNNISEDLQVGPSGNNTMSISNGLVTMTATGFSAANLIRIIPNRISALNKSTLTAQVQIGTLTANAADIGLMLYSTILHSGAQFGYMGFIQTSNSGTSTVFIYDQARSSQKATTSGFTYASNDIVEFVLDLKDTILTFSAQNLTTDPSGANKKTATYAFSPNSSAHILPNSYNWAIYDGSGTGGTTRTLRSIRIESSDQQYPNLLVLGNSKTKIGYATFWNGRFAMQLNATYPNSVMNAGGAERILDMIARLDEITQLSPSQVLLADIASNSFRAGVSITDVITQYEYIVNRLEGAGIRVLHMILPEDSTGGGIGQTAWHNYLSARFPLTYMANVYNDMSTNNIGDAIYLHADKIHLIQAGNDQATASIIASGMVQTISANRRAPFRTTDGLVKFTGDSLHFKYKMFQRDNYVLRWDNDNQSITTGVQYMDSLKTIFSTSSRPTSPLTNAMIAAEGPIVSYGTTGGRYLYDRSTPANNYAEYVNSNTRYTGYNGTDIVYLGTDGRMRIGTGTGVQSTTITGMLQIRTNRTFAGTQGRIGVNLNIDTTISTMPNTGHSFFAANSIGPHSIISTSAGNTTTAANFYIEDSVVASTNHVFLGTSYALYINKGKTRIGTTDSVGTPTGGILFKDFATGDIRLTAAPAGGSISGLTAGRVTLSTGATSIGDDGSLLYSSSNAGTLSLGTSTTVGHFNIGGNRNFDGTATATAWGVGLRSAPTTFTDNVTSASGTTNFIQNYLESPTLAATNATITATSPTTLRVDAPTQGTNVTVTIPYAITAFGGAVWFNGAVKTVVNVGVHNSAVTYTDNFTTCDASGGNFNINLPDAGTYSGIEFTFKRLDNSGNTCTVTRSGSDTIDGATNYSLSAQWKYVKVKSNGTMWLVIANN